MSTLSAPAAAPGNPSALKSHCRSIAERARTAAIDLAGVPGQTKAACLRAAAAAIRADVAEILAANKLDLAAAPGFGLTAAAIDRLDRQFDEIGAAMGNFERHGSHLADRHAHRFCEVACRTGRDVGRVQSSDNALPCSQQVGSRMLCGV